MNTLEIKNLHAKLVENDREILKGVDLTINSGEIHAIMGPNGAGKSSLGLVIMGHPKYAITEGEILFNGQNINEITTDEKAKLGLFMSMQNPIEIAGITNSDFIRTAKKELGHEEQNLFKFISEMEKNMDYLNLNSQMAHRYLNEGFSGGEKKKNEILQLLMMKPKLGILDEIDSGLDVDALQFVTKGINRAKHEDGFGGLIITHYKRILDSTDVDFVHIYKDGRIVKSGDLSLASEIEESGYENL